MTIFRRFPLFQYWRLLQRAHAPLEASFISEEKIKSSLCALFEVLCANKSQSPIDALGKHLGFSLSVSQSNIPKAGIYQWLILGCGVFINGHAVKGQLVAIYPGLKYCPWEPTLLQSINNHYMFRLQSGGFLDGKGHGMILYTQAFRTFRIFL